MRAEVNQNEPQDVSVCDSNPNPNAILTKFNQDHHVSSNGIHHHSSSVKQDPDANVSSTPIKDDDDASYVLVGVDSDEGGDEPSPVVPDPTADLNAPPPQIHQNGSHTNVAVSLPSTDPPSPDVEDAIPKGAIEESKEKSFSHHDSCPPLFEENRLNATDDVSLHAIPVSIEKSLNHHDSGVAAIVENGPETNDHDSLPVEDPSPRHVDSGVAGTDTKESNDNSLDHHDSGVAGIAENGPETTDDVSIEDPSYRDVEDAKESNDHHDSDQAKIEENGPETIDNVSLPMDDSPSRDAEDVNPETDAEESNEKSLDHDDSDQAEIEETIHDVSLPMEDSPSHDDEDVIPKTDSEESNENSLDHHDSYQAEIEEVIDDVSLPMEDSPSRDDEDVIPKTDSEESNEKSLDHHDSYQGEIEETIDDVSLPMEDSLSRDDEDVIPKTDSEESNESSLDHPESDLAAVENDPETIFPAADDVVSFPSTDLMSRDVEDVSPKTDIEESNEIPVEIENDAASEGETSSGLVGVESKGLHGDTVEVQCEDVSNDEANVGNEQDFKASADHTSTSLDSPVTDVDDKVVEIALPCDDHTGNAVDAVDAVDIAPVESDLKSEVVGSENDKASTFSPEATLEDQIPEAEVVKMPFYYIIRIPRCDDETVREQIKLAEAQVQERTKTRDSICLQVKAGRAGVKESSDKVQATLMEERAARDTLKLKRQEVDAVQSVISKLKSALSIDDIDARIRNMEHMIQHETMPLKEEKQYIREIKQLKQQRELICSSLGTPEEIKQTLDQKDQVEEQLKGLRKEQDSLRANVTKAEEVTQAAKNELKKEKERLNELVYQLNAADNIRQEAYARFQSLKKQHYEKNKHFWRYKDDVKVANELSLSKDKLQLQNLCVDQVERMMELWNRDDNFRREYIRCNTRSTLRRLRTFDGRSLGPDEVPPIIPLPANSRVVKHNSSTSASKPYQEKETEAVKTEQAAPVEKSAVAIMKKAEAERISEEKEEEERRLREEEEEVARKAEAEAKAEAKRKEEAAVKLKEQRKLEEKAKAKEAMERKKRIAEKAQARAEAKAQKEAEEKEKERERRARKKERKKAASRATNANGAADENEDDQKASADDNASVPATNVVTNETPSSVATAVKRAAPKLKISKTKATMPAPLRNRGKRRMQSWILPLVLVFVLLFVIVLLWKRHLLF